jgi:hypothetical protein
MSADVINLHQRLWDKGRSGELPIDTQIQLLEAAFRRHRERQREDVVALNLDSYWETVPRHDIG